jgi:hypothetical protein
LHIKQTFYTGKFGTLTGDLAAGQVKFCCGRILWKKSIKLPMRRNNFTRIMSLTLHSIFGQHFRWYLIFIGWNRGQHVQY